MLFGYVAKVAELERQNSNVEGELRARVNDIHSLQIMLNTSRPTNSVKALKGKISHSMDLLTPSSPGSLPTLCLTTMKLFLLLLLLNDDDN